MRAAWVTAVIVGWACAPAWAADSDVRDVLYNVRRTCTARAGGGVAVAERGEMEWCVTGLRIGWDTSILPYRGRIAKLPALRTLGLHGEWGALGDSIADFARLSQLRHLALPDDLGKESLEALSALEHLEGLDLQYCSKLKGADLVHLKSFPDLRRLVLPGHQIDASLESIAALPSLEELSLGLLAVGDASLVRLSSLTKLRSLEVGQLNLERETLGRNLPRLESLRIRECPSETGTIDLSGLAGITSLALDDVYVSTPAKVRLPTTLRRLKLGEDLGGPEPDDELELMPPLPLNLESLSVAMPRMGFSEDDRKRFKVWRPDLAWLDRFPGLSELTLWNVCEDDLEAAVQIRSLRALALGQTACGQCPYIADAALARLAALRGLESLMIGNMIPATDKAARVVTDAGIGALAGLGHFRRLELIETSVSPAGLASICGLTGLEALRVELPDEAPGVSILDILSGMSALTNLKELTLAGPVTDARLKCLKGLKGLRRLDVSGGKGYTDEGLAALVGSLPELKELVWSCK